MPIPLHYLALPLLLAATPAVAQSPFDGTWKGDLASAKMEGKPDHFSIKNGTYSCTTCIPAYSVPADGAFHPVKGKDYWDAVAVKVVDDHTVNYQYQKAGKLVSENSETVSADGNTLSMKSHDTNNGGGVPIDAAATATRVGAPMAGAHLVSGDWKQAPATSISDAALTMTLSVSGGMLHLKTGMGETLDAKIGGGYALNQLDPGKTMTKVEQLSPTSLKLTDMRAGKVTQVSTFTVGSDGKLHGSWTNPQSGATGTFTASKQ